MFDYQVIYLIFTGWKGGVIKLLDDRFGHFVQWCICSLHFIEKIYEWVACAIDGPSKNSGIGCNKYVF